MPTYHRGNYWEAFDEADLFLFTSNGVVRGGRLVMGAGTARQVRDKFPGIDKTLGRNIPKVGVWKKTGVYQYGLVVQPEWNFDNKPVHKIGAFQTKLHFKDNSLLYLINDATCKLKMGAEAYSWMQVHMPYPGIGFGKLEKKDVEPIIQ